MPKYGENKISALRKKKKQQKKKVKTMASFASMEVAWTKRTWFYDKELSYLIFLEYSRDYELVQAPRPKQTFTNGSFPEVGQKQKTERILQGLGVAQAAVAQVAVTECWP